MGARGITLAESELRAALRKGLKSKKYPLVPKSCLVQRFPSSNTVMINHHGTRELRAGQVQKALRADEVDLTRGG